MVTGEFCTKAPRGLFWISTSEHIPSSLQGVPPPRGPLPEGLLDQGTLMGSWGCSRHIQPAWETDLFPRNSVKTEMVIWGTGFAKSEMSTALPLEDRGAAAILIW